MATDGPPREPPLGVVSREPARRLFFALWPDEAMRAAMVQAVRKAALARQGSDAGCGGRAVPADNLHVTLAFLGSVPERRLLELAAAARGAAESLRSLGGADSPDDSIELVFDRLEYWRAAKLICALAAEPPARVAGLARKLQEALAGHGFAPDLKPFRPHVTLARRVHPPPRAMEMDPVTWSFSDFVLVDSKTLPEGSVYGVLERFPLGH